MIITDCNTRSIVVTSMLLLRVMVVVVVEISEAVATVVVIVIQIIRTKDLRVFSLSVSLRGWNEAHRFLNL